MKKLLLIILCLPIIGFGQNDISKYIYINTGYSISDYKIFQNTSNVYYGIGYNFYNINKYGIDFEVNYLNKNYQLVNSDDGLIFRGIVVGEDGDYDMTLGGNLSSKADFISLSFVNNFQLVSSSSLDLYFSIAPKFDVLLSEKWDLITSSSNKGKGNPQRLPVFSKTSFLANCGFGIKKTFNRLFIRTDIIYEYNFGESSDLIRIYNLNRDIFNNNIIFRLYIGTFI